MSCAEIAGASDSVGSRFVLGFDSGAACFTGSVVAATGATISFDSCAAEVGVSDDSRSNHFDRGRVVVEDAID